MPDITYGQSIIWPGYAISEERRIQLEGSVSEEMNRFLAFLFEYKKDPDGLRYICTVMLFLMKNVLEDAGIEFRSMH